MRRKGKYMSPDSRAPMSSSKMRANRMSTNHTRQLLTKAMHQQLLSVQTMLLMLVRDVGGPAPPDARCAIFFCADQSIISEDAQHALPFRCYLIHGFHSRMSLINRTSLLLFLKRKQKRCIFSLNKEKSS
jgi:hypothetical protein